jgi:hypothetical protein
VERKLTATELPSKLTSAFSDKGKKINVKKISFLHIDLLKLKPNSSQCAYLGRESDSAWQGET